MGRRVGWLFLILISTAASAEELTSTINENVTPQLNNPVGLGMMLGQASGESGYSSVVEGENHFKQRRGQLGFRQYGEGESRLELGTGFGLSMEATSGITLVGLHEDGEKLSPHLGIEPFSGRIALNTNGAREKYYEWLPMVSGGFQFAAGPCRILPLARAGGGLGDLGKSGIFPALGSAVGVGGYLDCSGFDLSGEMTHLNAASNSINLVNADLSMSLSHGKIVVGLRSERISESDRLEQRALLLLRSKISDLF